jgi:hypothetical protein
MNPWLQVAVPVIGQLIVAAFVYGQLTQRQKDQGGWLKAHEEKLVKHDAQLLDHEGRISKIEGRCPMCGRQVIAIEQQPSTICR